MVELSMPPKQATLLKTAKVLFWKYGIKRVTIAEICKESKVSKMTFYKFYDNKIDIAKVVLLTTVEEGIGYYRKVMQESIPFAEKVKKIIQLEYDNAADISKELLKDLYGDKLIELQDFLMDLQQSHTKEVLADFLQAAEEGEIRATIKPEFILYLLNKINEMIADEALLKHYKNEQEAIMELTNFFFYGLGVK